MNWYQRFVEFDYAHLLPWSSRLPAAMAYRAADFRGTLHLHLRRQSARHARENLRKIFPLYSAAQIEQILRNHYRTEARDELEACWYGRPVEFFYPWTRIEGLEMLRERAGAGRGVLLYSGHLGSSGFFCWYLGKLGVRTNVVARPIDTEAEPLSPAVAEFNRRKVKGIEEAVGSSFVLTGGRNYPAMLRHLRKGGTLILLMDVVPTLVRNTVKVNFLGRPARLAAGISSLFQATGARPILWLVHWDSVTRTHNIELRDMSGEVNRAMDRSTITQILLHPIEERILQHPADWWTWDSLSHFYSGASQRKRAQTTG